MTKPSSLWDRIHERLQSMNAIINTASRDLSEREMQLVMDLRAMELSQPSERQQLAGEQTMLIFSLSQEWYAADLQFTKGVIRPALYTPIPGTASFIAGIVNYRGMILTVLDLRPLFGLQRNEGQEDGAILVVEAGGIVVGILAESVEEITDLPLDQRGSALLTLTGTREEYTAAVIPYGDRLVAVLNLPALLQDPQLAVDEEV